MATTHESFHSGDGEEYFYDNLHEQGYLLMWRPAPYHWAATHIEKRVIISYTEGDVTETAYPTQEEYDRALQETKEWWIEYLGERPANMSLMGGAEPFGFLAKDTITLNPPRCPKCNRRMYPNNDGKPATCLDVRCEE